MSIKDLIQNKEASERARLKGIELAKARKNLRISRSNYDIQILDIVPVERGIEVFARAWKGKNKVGFGTDGSVDIERFRIFNPPVLVPDPNGPIIRVDTDFRGHVNVQHFREDPEEAILQTLEHTFSVVPTSGPGKIIEGKIGNTTSTFYPDADVESTSVDGYVYNEIVGTWASLRSDTSPTESPSSNSTLGIAACQRGAGSNWGSLFRFVMLFDTSAIPDTDVISAATLSLYGRTGADYSLGDSASTRLNLTSSNPASNTDLVSTDFNIANFGSTVFSTEKTFAGFSSGAYNDFTLDANGIANISKTGVSKFAARITGDITNTEPGGSAGQASEFRFEAADQTGTTQDPKLVVTHAAGASISRLPLLGVS